MEDKIRVLPDQIANQIAAGEVIQRPASVVKELMENALDADASRIRLIVNPSGKTLSPVIDAGEGMNETDARMCFERHATSKIEQSEDLFSIDTMGFRGEALASVAAVAQVDMRTKPHDRDIGTFIRVKDSEVSKQEPCQCTAGTNVAVKNIFYNVPARRKFLKSDRSELRHITEEFQRIALANPEIHFSLHHDDKEVFLLPPTNLRKRIVDIFGKKTNEKLVPVEEQTDVLTVDGFIGKPEYAKKTRGEQYLFINGRYIKSGYLHHAIMNAYQDLLAEKELPLYVLFLKMNPERIDINVHPTKEEVKFEDERMIYNFVRVAVRHALGQHNITPSLDFEHESPFPEGTSSASSSGNGSSMTQLQRDMSSQREEWEKLYKGLTDSEDNPFEEGGEEGGEVTVPSDWNTSGKEPDLAPREDKKPYQLHRSYVISPLKSGFVLIDQQSAHQRILFEQFLHALRDQEMISQNELFPRQIQLPKADAELLEQLIGEVKQLGFDIRSMGGGRFVLQSMPAELIESTDPEEILEQLVEQYRSNLKLDTGQKEKIARSLATSTSIRRGKRLTTEEMQDLIDQLFACDLPSHSPSGNRCFLTFDLEDLQKQLKS